MTESVKKSVLNLFERMELLEQDERCNDEGAGFFDLTSPAAKLLDELVKVQTQLLRIYAENLASKQWIFEQLTGESELVIDDEDKLSLMFDELKKWAKS